MAAVNQTEMPPRSTLREMMDLAKLALSESGRSTLRLSSQELFNLYRIYDPSVGEECLDLLIDDLRAVSIVGPLLNRDLSNCAVTGILDEEGVLFHFERKPDPSPPASEGEITTTDESSGAEPCPCIAPVIAGPAVLGTNASSEADFILTAPSGLHTRPAAAIAKAAMEFKGQVFLSLPGHPDRGRVDASNPMEVLLLEALHNYILRFTISSADPGPFLQALESLPFLQRMPSDS